MYLSNLLDQKLSLLSDRIKNQEQIIKDLECKITKLEKSNNKEFLRVKSGINLILDSVTELEDYRETCSLDLSTLASAITELYNVLNYMLGGKLLVKKEQSNEEEDFFEEDLHFEENIDEYDKKKKKKVYH
jgi:hypothetical protein